jgi:hypothetical protein
VGKNTQFIFYGQKPLSEKKAPRHLPIADQQIIKQHSLCFML